MIVTQTCTKRKHWNPIRGTVQPVDTWTLNTSSKKCASGTRIIQACNCISWFFLRVSEHRNLHSMVTAQSFSYFISSSSLLGMQVVWWNESKWTLSIYWSFVEHFVERGTNMNQNFLAQPGAASVARRGAVALASALRTERRVPFGSPGQVSWSGILMDSPDPKSNHIDFKLPLKEWKWSHAKKRTRDSRFQPQENISKGCGDNDRNIFGSEHGAPKSSGNFIVFPLTWQLLGFYTWSPKDPNCRHVLPARSIFHGSGHEHCCLMVCFTQWKSWNNQRQR